MARIAINVAIVALCVAAALALAYQLALHDQRARARITADVVLNRTALTTEQLASAFERMAAFKPAEACTIPAQRLMRQIDLSSSLLQGIGYIENDTLLCSSLGEPGPIAVGSVDYVSATDTSFRRQRDLPIAPGIPLLMVSARNGYAGLVHPMLIFNLMNDESELSTGVVSYSTRENIIYSAETGIDWSKADLPEGQPEGTYIDGDKLIAWERSPRWDHFTYAVLPMAFVYDEFRALSGVLVPVGLGVGLIALVVIQRLSASRASLPTLLRAGIGRNEILTVYQPIVDMRTGAWVGAEVLARWKRPNGEWVSPEVFVPIAERYGLIPRLTQKVVANCCAEIGKLAEANEGFFVSINISSADLREANFVAQLTETFASHNVPHRSIHFEITERSEVDAETEVQTIAALRDAGFQVGIDDFGIGYSNLAYLDLLHVDYLKIDRAFIAAIARGGQIGTQVVDHIIDLASKRGLALIAEGVEVEEQRNALLSRGVTFAQGWLFGKPLPVHEFVAGWAAQGAIPRDTDKPLTLVAQAPSRAA
jgi:sensor c-di-GMP phosphodiesterase-like protein